MDTVERGSAGGSTVQFGYSAGGARLWKKTDGQITGLWIGSLYEEKDGKVLCHVYAGGRLVATFEPEGGFACLIENNRYLAALWHCGDRTLAVFFGDGRTPVTVMWAAALAGLALGLRYNRRRLRDRYGLEAYYGVRCIGGTDPWRQMVLLCLAASVFLSSNPQAVYAGTPDYDPVFYYYHPDQLGSSQLMTDRDGDVVQHYGYSPFGRENYRNNTYAFSVSNRYTGQTLDEETGLYYYGARYYDPELARFIQADSTIPDPEFSQAYNRYAYVYNNPLKFTDPTGQNPFVAVMAYQAVAAAKAYALQMAIIKVVGTAMVSGMISAGIAAATGGNPGQAFWGGFIGGAAGAIGGVAGAVAGGALGALVTGSDPLMGALTAGISVGVTVAFTQSPLASAFDFLGDEYLEELALSTASGAFVGGVTAEIMGGDFGQGAAYGAASAAAGYVVYSATTKYMPVSYLEKGKSAYLTIETESGNRYRIKLDSPDDWAAEILKYSHNDDKIQYPRHEGHGLGAHGDKANRGQGLIVGRKRLVAKGWAFGDPDVVGLRDLIDSGDFQNAFASHAVIEIRPCYSAFHSSGQTSFAYEIKKAVPWATVKGYTGQGWGIESSNRILWLHKPQEVSLRSRRGSYGHQRVSTMRNRSRAFWAIFVAVIVIFCAAVAFFSVRLPVPPSERVRSTKASLSLARSDIKQFRDSFGRYPHTLTEAMRTAQGLDDDAPLESPWCEYLSKGRGNSTEHQVLNGEGGWYYNEATGELKVNLNDPLRHYLPRHSEDMGDQIPSNW